MQYQNKSNIINNSITTIVVQFNYGFFNFEAFSQFIRKIKKHKIICLDVKVEKINFSQL